MLHETSPPHSPDVTAKHTCSEGGAEPAERVGWVRHEPYEHELLRAEDPNWRRTQRTRQRLDLGRLDAVTVEDVDEVATRLGVETGEVEPDNLDRAWISQPGI